MILTPEQLAILAHVVHSPQAWADHAAAVRGEDAVLDKIAKYRADWLANKDLPGYQTAAERNAPPPSPNWSRDPILNKVRAARCYALNAVGGILTTALATTPVDHDLIDACKLARQALLDMTKLPSVMAATDDTSLTVALVQAYAAITTAAPVAIQNAFADMHL